MQFVRLLFIFLATAALPHLGRGVPVPISHFSQVPQTVVKSFFVRRMFIFFEVGAGWASNPNARLDGLRL